MQPLPTVAVISNAGDPGALARRLVLGTAAGVVALLVNLYPVELFPSAHMLLGQVPVLAAAVLGGPLAGLVAAALGGIPTRFLWGHAWGLALLVLEAAVVGRYSRRAVPLVVDSLFWLLAPLFYLLTYHLGLGTSLLTATAVWGKQASNSLFALLLVQAALLVPRVRRALRAWLPESLRVVAIRPVIASALALGASVPLFVLGSAEGWRLYDGELQRLRASELAEARLAARDVERTVLEARNAVAVLASSLGNKDGTGPPVALTPELRAPLARMVAYTRAVVGAQILDAGGAVVAGAPEPGAALAPESFVRQHGADPGGRVSGVLPGRAPLAGSFVFAVAPILDGSRVIGHVLAALDPGRIAARARVPEGEELLVLDAEEAVVHDSRPQATPGARGSPLSRAALALRDGATALQPEPGPPSPSGRETERVLAAAAIPSLGWRVVVDRSVDAMQVAVERAMLGLLLTVAVAVALVIAGSAFLSRVVSAPLQHLATATARLAAGDRSVRVRESAIDAPLEVLELSARFDAMAEELQRQMAAAEEASREKDAFLSVASHELRTPLTVLKARLELALRRAHDGERERLEPLVRQVDRLARLLAQLLDASRLQTGALPISRAHVHVDEVVRRVAETLVAASPDHELQLRLEPVEGDLDELRLEQVLQNLVGNALKYSPRGGPVEITVRGVESDVEIAVADRGIGVPGAQASFERFSRGEDVQGIAGLGIGLHVSEEITRRHGGSLRLIPREGGGAVAVVRLPRSSA